MTAPTTRRPVAPRLALRRDEAAAALGISLDHFERYVAGELRAVYLGRVRLYSVAVLERWLGREAVAPVSETEGRRQERMDRGIP